METRIQQKRTPRWAVPTRDRAGVPAQRRLDPPGQDGPPMAARVRYGEAAPAPRWSGGAVVQRKGAVPLREMLELNGAFEADLRVCANLLDLLKRYTDAKDLDFATQAGLLQDMAGILPSSSLPLDAGPLVVVARIVKNELDVVKGQEERFAEHLTGANAGRIEEKEKEIEELKSRAENPFREKKLAKAREELAKLTTFPPPERQTDPYRFMERGSEWKKPEYQNYYSGPAPRDMIRQLSDVNLKRIQNAALIHEPPSRPAASGGSAGSAGPVPGGPARVIFFRELPACEALCGRIRDVLVSQTLLAHYSEVPDLPVLLSQEYAAASKMNLAANNSDKGKERDLLNTGFVFFFLESRNQTPRGSRFGSYRYEIDTSYAMARGILSRSWAMMVDFHTGYLSFAKDGGVTVYPPRKEQGAAPADRSVNMKFEPDGSALRGAMTYLPSGVTLKFEPVHNILKGNDILEGVSRFAAQQLFAAHYNGREMGFDQLPEMSDSELLDTVLRMFRLQIMAPCAVAPQRRFEKKLDKGPPGPHSLPSVVKASARPEFAPISRRFVYREKETDQDRDPARPEARPTP